MSFWKYCVEEGELHFPDGKGFVKGASGRDAGLNNPSMAHSAVAGPIPPGHYTIDKDSQGESFLGPDTILLLPGALTVVHGRSGFFCHGPADEDVIWHTTSACHCCLELPQFARKMMLASPIKDLLVVENASIPL